MKEEISVLGVAGNHDVGFGETSNLKLSLPSVILSAHSRYLANFGPINALTRVANHSIITLDTIGLSSYPSSPSFIAANQFISSLTGEQLGPRQKRILISHVPLWRPEGADCGLTRRMGPIRNMKGYQYQSTLMS